MSTFTFIQITDHHLRERESDLTFGFSSAHAFRATLRHIAQHAAARADFIVTTGDLVNNGTDAEYQAARAMLGIRETSEPPGSQRVSIEGLREMPMYFLPGNHDPREVFFRNMFPGHLESAAPKNTSGAPRASSLASNVAAQPDASTRAPAAALAPPSAASQPGSSPLLMNAAFTHKGVRFICLDWGGDSKAVAHPAMVAFLADSLRDGTPSIIFMHHALASVRIPRLDALLPDDATPFANVIRGSSVLAVFCGHFHATYEIAIAGIPVYGLRSTTYSFAPEDDKVLIVLRPPHYRIVTVADGKVTTEVIEVTL